MSVNLLKLDSLSRSEKVAKEELRVNQGTLNENLIVEIRDKYYKVIFNNNFTAYELKEINLINPEIVIIDK